MQRIFFILVAVALASAGCKKEPPPAKPASTVGDNPLTAPADYVGAIGQAHKSAVKTLGTAQLDQAIKVFFEQEGRYPKSLDELVSTGAMPKLPAPPRGMKFDYDSATGKVKVVAQ